MTRQADQRTNLFQKLSIFVSSHRITFIALFLVLAILGSLSYTTFLKREGFPAIQVPIAIASGTYFVNDAEKVDTDVLKPIQAQLDTIDTVTSVQTSTDANIFSVFVEFTEATSSEDAVAILEKAAEDANLPESAQISIPPINVSKYLNRYTVLIAMYGKDDSMTLAELQARAGEVAGDLKGVEGTIETEVLPVLQSGVNPATGKTTLVQTGFSNYGELEDGKLEARPNVLVGLVVDEEVDALHYSDRVNAKLDELEADSKNADIALAVAADDAPSVSTQIESLQGNLIDGLLIVSVMTFLFISIRASIVMVLFMILTVLSTLLVLWLIGYSLNTITLFALVLSLGLFVDDATVVVEAIDANRKKAKNALDVIKIAVGKAGAASFAGSFSITLVFVPLAFVSGLLGSFIRIMPITVIISLVISLVLSLTFIPLMSYYFMLGPDKKFSFSILGPVVSRLAAVLSYPPRLATRSSTKLGRLRGALIALVMVGLAGASLAGAGYYAQKVTFDIFPSAKDSDLLALSILYPEGTTIEQAQDIAADVNERTAKAVEPGMIESIAYSVNSASGRMSDNRGASALITLKPFNERDIKSPEIISSLQASVADVKGAKVTFGQLDAGPPAEEYPFKVQIFTDDAANAREYANELSTFLNGSDVKRINGTTAKITDVELSNFDRVVREDGKRYFQVGASFDADDTTSLVQAAQQKVEDDFNSSRLEQFGLTTDDIRFDFGQESENQESFKSMLLVGVISIFVMYMLLGIQFGDKSNAKLLSKSLFAINILVTAVSAGIVYLITEEVVGSLIGGLMFGTAAHLFGSVYKPSFIKPLLIFMAVPFSLFGVFAGLYLTDNPLSFFAMVGFFGLIGIAVNNTILLTEYAEQERRAGSTLSQAIIEATTQRLRPLLTTSITTILALLPLALSDPFWEGLAFTMIFGLISSTVLVIVSFPFFYLIVEAGRARFKRFVYRLVPSGLKSKSSV